MFTTPLSSPVLKRRSLMSSRHPMLDIYEFSSRKTIVDQASLASERALMRKAAGVDRSKSSTPRPHRRRPPAASPLVRPTSPHLAARSHPIPPAAAQDPAEQQHRPPRLRFWRYAQKWTASSRPSRSCSSSRRRRATRSPSAGRPGRRVGSGPSSPTGRRRKEPSTARPSAEGGMPADGRGASCVRQPTRPVDDRP
jgi:hypothetical protein